MTAAQHPSTTELQRSVANLVTKLNKHGHTEAATELQDGLSCLNGMTDGWAALADAIEKVISDYAKTLSTGDLQELEKVSVVVKDIVYR